MKTVITKDLIRNLRVEINAALVPIGQKFGVKLDAGNASFTADNINFKLLALAIGEGGEVVTPEKTDLARYGPMDGIPAEYLAGRDFLVNGERVVLVGYRVKAREKPYIVQAVDRPDKPRWILRTEALLRILKAGAVHA